LAVKKAP